MNRISLLFAAVFGLASPLSFAVESDLKQEIKIEAAGQFADIKNKQVVYQGPVSVRQGTLAINADELSATQKDGKTILIAKGKPATYSQILENNLPAKASAYEIQYDLSEKILTLVGKAQVEQGDSKVSAEKIIYDIEKQQLKAQGNQQKTDRVITVIKPENFEQQLQELEQE